MKKLIQSIIVTVFITTCSMFTYSAFSQDPGAPPPPNHGTEGNQAEGGRGAPIGGGLLIMLGLGGAYGGYKAYRESKNRSSGN